MQTPAPSQLGTSFDRLDTRTERPQCVRPFPLLEPFKLATKPLANLLDEDFGISIVKILALTPAKDGPASSFHFRDVS